MDKLTEAKQVLWKQLCDLLKKYRDQLSVSLTFNNRWRFYSKHYGVDANYTSEMGWERNYGDTALIVLKLDFRGIRPSPPPAGDAEWIGDAELEDLEQLIQFMPVVERFLEIEAANDPYCHVDDELDDDDDE